MNGNDSRFPLLSSAERTCGVEEWTCQSGKGQCIPMAWVCDEHEDCDDASDMDEPMASQGQVGDSNNQKKLHFKYVDRVSFNY